MSKMQNETAWEDDIEIIRRDTEKWWKKNKDCFAIATKKEEIIEMMQWTS
jgi:hypothetical protein